MWKIIFLFVKLEDGNKKKLYTKDIYFLFAGCVHDNDDDNQLHFFLVKMFSHVLPHQVDEHSSHQSWRDFFKRVGAFLCVWSFLHTRTISSFLFVLLDPFSLKAMLRLVSGGTCCSSLMLFRWRSKRFVGGRLVPLHFHFHSNNINILHNANNEGGLTSENIYFLSFSWLSKGIFSMELLLNLIKLLCGPNCLKPSGEYVFTKVAP